MGNLGEVFERGDCGLVLLLDLEASFALLRRPLLPVKWETASLKCSAVQGLRKVGNLFSLTEGVRREREKSWKLNSRVCYCIGNQTISNGVEEILQ